jgi:dissimilatory sulfite reductase (desulfoviridin) alpha/beta subunit
MIIGQPFVDFVLEHHPTQCRRLTKEEALDLLKAEHERGHVHAAWFKDACLDRFFAICNCCKCCCGGIQAMVRHGIPMMASSGYVAHVDQSLCCGCGQCQEACPFDAVSVNGKAAVQREDCVGCGVCVGKCPEGAASLGRDPSKGVPLDVRLLGTK